MRLSSGNYANFKAIVLRLIADQAAGTSATSVFYRMDTSISKVAEAWAVVAGSVLLVYGDFGNQGPSQATFQGDFTNDTEVTTSIGVTES